MSKRIRIGIDGYEANAGGRVGIGRYAFEILRHMAEILDKGSFPDASATVFLPSPPVAGMPVAGDRFDYRIVGGHRFWTYVTLPAAVRQDGGIDVFFSPTHYIPRGIRTPRVASVMDLSYLHYPSLFRWQDRYKLTYGTKYSVTHATRLLTISEASRNDILGMYGVPADKVAVTYPALSGTVGHASMEKQDLIRKYGIHPNYILSVGTLQPRKNHERLIEAFSGFLKKNRQRFGQIDLLIVGKKGWLYEDILSAPARLGVADRVRFLDYVPDEDLAPLYRHALAFALPSLYEGFGLPVLEAMAQGCPVVVSDVSSLPEIAGKAGIYVNPEDTGSITEGLLTAVRQRNLKQGRMRIQAGHEQVKKFSWERAAKQTLEVLVAVAQEGKKE